MNCVAPKRMSFQSPHIESKWNDLVLRRHWGIRRERWIKFPFTKHIRNWHFASSFIRCRCLKNCSIFRFNILLISRACKKPFSLEVLRSFRHDVDTFIRVLQMLVSPFLKSNSIVRSKTFNCVSTIQWLIVKNQFFSTRSFVHWIKVRPLKVF